MMSRPVPRTLVVHGFAFFMGLGGAMLVPDASPSSSQPSHAMPKPERTRRADRDDAGAHLTSTSSFRAAYSALVERSMTGNERSACMEKFWERWGEADPVGMLAFLENKRGWPDDCRSYNLPLSSRPDLLLDFALRHGSSDALRSLGHADPLTVARLLAAIPEEERGEEIVMLAKATDRELGRLGIAMDNPSPAYLRGVAETLIEQGRIDEFLDAFEKIEDSKERNDLARKFGEELGNEKPDDEILALVLRLPEPYRMEAAYNLIRNESSLAMEFPEVREARKRQIEGFAQAGLVEAAAQGVSNLFSDKHAPSRGEEMAAWIANFPSDGSWKPVTDEILRAWYQADREGMIQQIRALPESPVRQMLAVEAAEATIGGLAQPYSVEQQRIRDGLSGLFTDPLERKQFEERFAPWAEQSGGSDPFAPAEDPFAPVEDPFAEEGQ